MFAVHVRIPVTRTYPSEVEIPGRLFIQVCAYSSVSYPIGSRVVLDGTTCQAEVYNCHPTGRVEDAFGYSISTS